MRCPKHKVSQSACPQQAAAGAGGGRVCLRKLQTRIQRTLAVGLPPDPGPGRVERPRATGRPVPRGAPHHVVCKAGRDVWKHKLCV